MDFRPEFKREGGASNDCIPLYYEQHFGSSNLVPGRLISSSLPPQQSMETKDFSNLKSGKILSVILDQLLKNGMYELKEEIGKGVFSNVYKAINRHTKENVVIKIYKSSKVNYTLHAKEEVKMLQYLSTVDQDADVFGSVWK